jgi:deazaflavin-dependent oxidoreductase (nitroreductase family)
MTAAEQPALRLPPRPLIKVFWRLHRAAYRITGGRFGLNRPETGEKFGMMRLTTVGRKSGKSRVAIVGYYEDGANLVTLAMNGWGDAEPAWWLNLQASPETAVDLDDGRRAVRARAATGIERDRLWVKFDDYPGWGNDLNGLAALRASHTAVVVFEPRTLDETMAARSTADPSRASSPAAIDPADRSESRSRVPARRASGGRRLRRRHLWLVPGLGLAFFANFQAPGVGVGLVPLLAFGLAPDLPRAIGLQRPFALPIHNLLHQPVLPIAMLLGNSIFSLSAFAYIGALAWLGHIVVGWGTGDRIRRAQAPARLADPALALQAIQASVR